MKFCACVAEYNPLHLGHLKHIEYMKNSLNAEYLIVIMSGNFTQRGEIAVMNKFKRAEQAIKAGADLVIELPTVFATANAEIFAKGAVKILSELGVDGGLCFGVESGDRQAYLDLARAMNNESKEFKKALKVELEKGISLAKAKFNALKSLGNDNLDEKIINSPNNVLGLEYTKAILSTTNRLEIYPMHRDGNHNDKSLKKDITSATSIRQYLRAGKPAKIKKYLQKYTYQALTPYPCKIEDVIISHAITTSTEQMALIPDCTEGLENRIKALVKNNTSYSELIEKVATKRYTHARISRILTANLLGITQGLVDKYLATELYAKVLAVSNNSKHLLTELASKSRIPVLIRKSDLSGLKKTAEDCFNIDVLANDIYNLVSNENNNENYTVFV